MGFVFDLGFYIISQWTLKANNDWFAPMIIIFFYYR